MRYSGSVYQRHCCLRSFLCLSLDSTLISINVCTGAGLFGYVLVLALADITAAFQNGVQGFSPTAE